jgi:hypothetical protein
MYEQFKDDEPNPLDLLLKVEPYRSLLPNELLRDDESSEPPNEEPYGSLLPKDLLRDEEPNEPPSEEPYGSLFPNDLLREDDPSEPPNEEPYGSLLPKDLLREEPPAIPPCQEQVPRPVLKLIDPSAHNVFALAGVMKLSVETIRTKAKTTLLIPEG